MDEGCETVFPIWTTLWIACGKTVENWALLLSRIFWKQRRSTPHIWYLLPAAVVKKFIPTNPLPGRDNAASPDGNAADAPSIAGKASKAAPPPLNRRTRETNQFNRRYTFKRLKTRWTFPLKISARSASVRFGVPSI